MKYLALIALIFMLWDGLVCPQPNKMSLFQGIFFMFGWVTTILLLIYHIFH